MISSKTVTFIVATVTLSISHAAAEHAPPKRMPAALVPRPPLIAMEPLPLGLECKDGSVRAFASGDGFNYSLPVRAEGSPVVCGPDAKGRRLSKPEMDAAVDATYQEYRDHRASLRPRP